MPEIRGLAPALLLSDRLAKATTSEPHTTLRAIESGAPNCKVVSQDLSENSHPPDARLQCAHQDRPRLWDAFLGPRRQRRRSFIPNRDLKLDAPIKGLTRASRCSRSQPDRPAPRRPTFRLDAFGCCRCSSFCWRTTSPCALEVGL